MNMIKQTNKQTNEKQKANYHSSMEKKERKKERKKVIKMMRQIRYVKNKLSEETKRIFLKK